VVRDNSALASCAEKSPFSADRLVLQRLAILDPRVEAARPWVGMRIEDLGRLLAVALQKEGHGVRRGSELLRRYARGQCMCYSKA